MTSRRSAWVLLVAALTALGGSGRARPAAEQLGQGTGGMRDAAVRLGDGTQLLLRGQVAFLRDREGRERPVAALRAARTAPTLTLLSDGRILVLGASQTGLPAPGEVITLGSQATDLLALPQVGQRAGHTATLLTDGRVLVVGGLETETGVATAALIASDLRTVELVPGLSWRSGHRAQLLPDGTIRISGGRSPGGGALHDEIFMPDARSFAIAGPEAAGTPQLELMGTSPSDGTPDVPLDVVVGLRFSSALDPDAIAPGTVVLSDGGVTVGTRLVLSGDERLLFVHPDSALVPGTEYRIDVSGLRSPSKQVVRPATVRFVTAAKDGSPPPDDEEIWAPTAEGPAGWRTNRPPSPWEKLPRLRAAAGKTALSGQLLRLNGQPLAGVRLSVGEARTVSDATGRYLLTGLVEGTHELLVDARRAGPAGRNYGVYEIGVDIEPETTTALPYVHWLPRIDQAHAVTVPVPTSGPVVISTPYIKGLELHLAPDTVVQDVDGRASSSVGITPIPLDRTPFPLPEDVYVPVYFTVQPGGAYLYRSDRRRPARARLLYPNYRDAPVGEIFEFWRYQPRQGWHVYGQGAVEQTRRQIVPDAGVGVYEFNGAMVADPSFAPAVGPPPCNECTDADPVDLSTGLFVYSKTDVWLPDVMPIGITRTYRQSDFQSRAFGLGTTHQFDIFLVGSRDPWTYMYLIMPDGGRLYFPRISAGTHFTSAVYEHTSSPSRFHKAIIRWDSSGRWFMHLRDGTQMYFPDSEFAQRFQLAAVTSIQDRFFNQIFLTRDANGNLTRIQSPSRNRSIELSYNASQLVTEVRDNLGRTVTYEYTGGALTRVTDVEGGVTEYTYASGRMTSIKDPRGIVYLQNDYDSSSRVRKQTLADGAVYRFAYTVGGTGRIVQTDVTDPHGVVRRVTFNDNRYWLTDTRALGRPEAQTITVDRDPATNFITATVDALGRRTEFEYTVTGELERVRELAGTADEATTTAVYGASWPEPTAVIDPAGRTTRITLSDRGAIGRVTDPLGHSVVTEVDWNGQVTRTRTAAGTQTWERVGGDVVGFTDERGIRFSRPTDGAGRVQSFVDGHGARTSVEYNAFNQPTRVIDASGGVTRLTYDGNGNVLTLTDPGDAVTEFSYDVMDRLATRLDPVSRLERFTYDLLGNLIQHEDRKGQTTTFAYDALNRLTRMTSADGAVTSYQYDAGNRLRQIVDSVAGTIEREYDDHDQLTSETTPVGSVAYTYDIAGRRESMTVSGQPVTTYDYDDADRLTTLSRGTDVVSFTYDDADRRTSATLPNGIVVTYGYDAASNLTSLTYSRGGLTLGTLTYTYDLNGRRETRSGTWAGTLLPPPVTATYDAASQLATWNGEPVAYDANGNLVFDGSRQFGWDARNRLTAIGGLDSVTFTHDGAGRRQHQDVAGGVRGYVYDGLDVVHEVGPGGDVPLLTGPGLDETWARAGPEGSQILLPDGLGSTVALADASGAIQTTYLSEPFGRTVQLGQPSSNTRQFTGREADASDLLYLRARTYSASLHRFLTEDPVGFSGGSLNLHAYVANDPANLTDRMGLWIDLIADAGFILYDLYRLAFDGRKELGSNLAALGGDVLGAVVPGLTGVGQGVRANRGRIIIGENMERVEKAARKMGGETFTGRTLEENRRWIREKMAEGYEVCDIGPDFARRKERRRDKMRPDSPFYNLERQESKGYEGYSKHWSRNGRR